LAFLTLIVLSIIDLRLQLIPDSLNVFLVFLGLTQLAVFYYFHNFGLTGGAIAGSFLGRYALIFWFGQSLWLNFALGAALGLSLFGALYLLTRGRGMGLGDVKFGLALGFLFGWPDILFVSILAFILGSIIGVLLLARGKKKMKDSLAFGPFLSLGAAIIFFFGYNILDAYFKLFGF
jgi:prepilin signal peptidase PulO-like enzyme (type II secretory pathway)